MRNSEFFIAHFQATRFRENHFETISFCHFANIEMRTYANFSPAKTQPVRFDRVNKKLVLIDSNMEACLAQWCNSISVNEWSWGNDQKQCLRNYVAGINLCRLPAC